MSGRGFGELVEIAVELLNDARLERDVLCAGVDRVQDGTVASNFLLRAVHRSRFFGDERPDAIGRCGDVLDRVGGLDALDPRDLSQCLERLRVLHPKRALAPLRLIYASKHNRHRSGHHADLAIESSERMHREKVVEPSTT